MKTVHSLLFQALEGGEPVHDNVWEHVPDPHQDNDKSTKHRTQVGEGGMYM